MPGDLAHDLEQDSCRGQPLDGVLPAVDCLAVLVALRPTDRTADEGTLDVVLLEIALGDVVEDLVRVGDEVLAHEPLDLQEYFVEQGVVQGAAMCITK